MKKINYSIESTMVGTKILNNIYIILVYLLKSMVIFKNQNQFLFFLNLWLINVFSEFSGCTELGLEDLTP